MDESLRRRFLLIADCRAETVYPGKVSTAGLPTARRHTGTAIRTTTGSARLPARTTGTLCQFVNDNDQEAPRDEILSFHSVLIPVF
jgi:hypothetical protein